MKPQVLLYSRDRNFGGLLAEALSGTASVLVAPTVADALQIVCQRGQELAFALMDFDGGCRGMTLLSAVHSCYEQLPILVTTSEDAEHAAAIAFANGARGCFTKPDQAATLTAAIADLNETHHLAAA